MKNFIAILFLFYACCSVAQTIVFKGHVADAKTCEDIPFATVRIASLNLETQTDFEGNFKFEKLLPGKYTFTIGYVGYLPLQSVIEVKKNISSFQQFYLTGGIILDARDPLEYAEPLIAPANDSIPHK